jgi:hypothetical protein
MNAKFKTSNLAEHGPPKKGDKSNKNTTNYYSNSTYVTFIGLIPFFRFFHIGAKSCLFGFGSSPTLEQCQSEFVGRGSKPTALPIVGSRDTMRSTGQVRINV